VRPLPKTVAEVKSLTMSECYATIVAAYLIEVESYLEGRSEAEAIQAFRERHPEHEVPLALLKRALS
jgi:hypothetical protein